jgi:CPA2 family monovalent cation:H+ antiporter-2
MDVSLLKDIVIILGLSVVVLLLFNLIRIPSILAFFVTGIVIGPSLAGAHRIGQSSGAYS